MPQALPANPNLDWLKKTAKQRLVQLRTSQSDAKLHQAQLAVAHDYGFKSWRALKSHVDSISPTFRGHDRVFKAAHAGDVGAVRRAFASGFARGLAEASRNGGRNPGSQPPSGMSSVVGDASNRPAMIVFA